MKNIHAKSEFCNVQKPICSSINHNRRCKYLFSSSERVVISGAVMEALRRPEGKTKNYRSSVSDETRRGGCQFTDMKFRQMANHFKKTENTLLYSRAHQNSWRALGAETTFRYKSRNKKPPLGRFSRTDKTLSTRNHPILKL